MAFEGNRRKVSSHLSQNESLVFEKSSPGKKAYKMPPLDVPDVDPETLLGEAARGGDLGLMPELSEIEIIRHFTRLSTWNYAIDLGMYPLGSCTMKYNPRVNEFVSRLEGIAEAHPYQPESLSQGALAIIHLLKSCLLDITGMDTITLQPAAGAHGEFTGILLTRAYHQSKGNPRRKVIIPDSAHGTNPATAAICGYQVENLRSNQHGMVDIEQLAKQVDEQTAALMLTNPSTIGVFESEIHKIADVLHAKGALRERFGLVGMRFGDAFETRYVLVDARVVFHGAGAKRIHAEVDRVIPRRKPREVANHFDFTDFGEIFHAAAAMTCAKSLRGIDCRHVERRQFERALAGRGLLEDQPFVLIGVPRRFFDLVTHCVLVVSLAYA